MTFTGWPIVGSVPELPEKLSWLKFADWGQQYGPIYTVNLAGHNHVWISKDSIAHDLLSKRAAIYSDRPHIPALISDNRTSGQYLPLMSKNELWTRQRKFANHIMRGSETASFYEYPELEAVRMLKELIEDPSRYYDHLESFVARVTCRLAWGHSEGSDELKQRARELLIGVSPTGALGNKLPFLMALPDWLSPAKAWERRRALTEKTWFRTMQQYVIEESAAGNARPSWTKMFLDAPALFNFKDSMEGAYAVGMHGIAGALTIAAPMQAFCLAMCHYPQYLPMLQEEIDRVCPGRLPTNADKPNLPFLRAVIREVIRWRPPVPTGIPHYLTEDDQYEGYFIPKGSIIHPLEWSICRDPELFPDPDAFNPLRWLRPEFPTYREPLTQYPTIVNMTQFGYGRRTCQGQTVTEADLVAGIGAIAWCFNISKAPTKTEAMDQEAALRKIMMNEKATISEEELVTGLSEHSSDIDSDIGSDDGIPLGAAFPPEAPFEFDPLVEKEEQSQPEVFKNREEDPTLQFSTLLIAKPLPFSFSLTLRDQQRAKFVYDLFAKKRSKGEFGDAKEYCEYLPPWI